MSLISNNPVYYLEKILSQIATGEGGAILSVTGGLVDNTDPINPVVSLSTAQLAKLNSTTEIIEAMKSTAAIGNTVKTDGALATMTMVGTSDETLPPPDSPQPTTGGNYNGYQKVTGLSTIKEGGYLTVSGDDFLVGTGGAGDYSAPVAWIDVISSLKDTTIGFVFAVETAGQLYFSQRPVGNKTKSSNSQTNLGGGGFLTLADGDKLSLWVAADTDSDITITDMNIGLKMDVSATLKAL